MKHHRTSVAVVAVLAAIAIVTPANAEIWQFLEDFSFTQYKDPVYTTAHWDTINGEVKLPPFQPILVTGYTTSDKAFGVEVSGDYAYVGIGGSGIQVFNISNPVSPSPVGAYNTPGFAYCAKIAGDYAYVADRAAGLVVLDVSNPASPSLVGSYDTPSEATSVYVDGDYAYVADYMSGLQVIDVSDPTNPVLAGSYDTGGYAYDVEVAGDYAYVADHYGGVRVIDVSDPTNPIQVATHATGNNAYSVSVSGDILCVSVWAVSVRFLDISDPTSPVLLATFNGGHNLRVITSGNYAYVSDGDYGLKVLDFSDPSAPVLAGIADTPVFAEWTALHGDYAFVADWSAGLRVIRIADPVTPRFMGEYGTSGNARNVAVCGDYAFVAAESSGVHVVDINDPTAPFLAGGYNTAGSARSVAVWGNHAYVADEGAGLQVVDISDPALPVLAGAYDTPGSALDVVVSGDYAYVADDTAGLFVVGITDPAAPDSAGHLDTDGNAYGLAISGDYAFLADYDAGLKVIDISDPGAPSLLGSYDTPGSAWHVAVAGDYAFVADDASGVQVIDISNPATPTSAGSFDTDGYARRVGISGDYAFVADMSAGVVVLDIGTPSSPSLLGSYATPDDACGLVVSDNYAYAAGSGSGLQIVEVFQRSFDLDADAAQSAVIEAPAQIMRARLSTTQQDTVQWELSADGGANWLGVPPDDTWYRLTDTGDSLVWRSRHTYAGGGVNPACSEVRISLVFDIPQIEEITDVANDQGRQVSVSWLGSGFDYVGSATPVTQYAVYRKIDEGLTLQAAPAGDDPAGPRAYPPGDWHFLMTVPARCEDRYAVVVPTLVDSTITGGMYNTTFFVSALTATPGVYFDSAPDSGYSVDNLAPGVPGGFMVAYNAPSGGNDLVWEECPDADFRYFCVYRSTDPAFPEAGTELVHMTTATVWTDDSDDAWRYYYQLTAIDFSGNESGPAMAGTVTGAGGEPPVPATFALHQNEPNPFNPTTAIRYDVPTGGGYVTIRVYDVGGRLVRTLVDGPQAAGARQTVWNGRDDNGVMAASGVYFCRLTAPGFEQTRKMVLLQ